MLSQPESLYSPWPYSLLIAMFINGDIGREWKIQTYTKMKPMSERAMLK